MKLQVLVRILDSSGVYTSRPTYNKIKLSNWRAFY